MTESLKEIGTWFNDRPKWLQDATRRIIQKSEITESDIKELIELCKAEAGIVTTDIKFIGIPAGSLNFKEEKTSLRLNAYCQINLFFLRLEAL